MPVGSGTDYCRSFAVVPSVVVAYTVHTEAVAVVAGVLVRKALIPWVRERPSMEEGPEENKIQI